MHTQPPSEDASEIERVLEAIERARPKLKRLLASFRVPREDAEDLCQDLAILALTRSRQAIELDAWLLGVARNLCLTRLRARSRRGEAPREALPEQPLPSPEATFIASVDLEVGLARLAPRHREVVRLRLEGNSSREAAARTGYTEGGVRKVFYRAVARIKVHR